MGNPYRMQDQSQAERNRVCDQYAVWLQDQINHRNPNVLQALDQIKELAARPEGVTLGCFCSPKRCHGDTIKTLLCGEGPAVQDLFD